MAISAIVNPMVPDPINFSAIKRVLVIKLRHHGDVLLASPVFQVLKNHAPQLEIDALIYHDTFEMLSGHPAISQLHLVNRNWKRAGIFSQATAEWKLLSALRSRKYDVVIHLTEHKRGIWLTRLLSPQFALAEKRKDAGWNSSFTHLYTLPSNALRHVAEMNLDALRRVGVYPIDAEKTLVLIPGNAAEANIDAVFAQYGLNAKQFIHIHPTSRWFFKTWPAAKMAALISALQKDGHQIVLTAAPTKNEREMMAAINATLTSPVIDLSGTLSLKELAALTARARAFVGVDSAPMHIAAAMQTPTVALFGPSGEAQWGPWGVAHRIVTSAASNHRCRPCGMDGCGGSKVSDCLTQLPVQQVLAALNELLATQ